MTKYEYERIVHAIRMARTVWSNEGMFAENRGYQIEDRDLKMAERAINEVVIHLNFSGKHFNKKSLMKIASDPSIFLREPNLQSN